MVTARGREKEEKRREREEEERGRTRAGLEGWCDDSARGGKKIEEKKDGVEGRLFLQNTIGITFGVISVSSSYNSLNSFSRVAIRVGATPSCLLAGFTSRRART